VEKLLQLGKELKVKVNQAVLMKKADVLMKDRILVQT
jgi:hypothetical protein